MQSVLSKGIVFRLIYLLKDKRLLKKHDYFDQSIGKLLVELADEIPPVVVDHQTAGDLFNAGELFWIGYVWGAFCKEALKQYKDAMKNGSFGREFLIQSLQSVLYAGRQKISDLLTAS